MSDEDMPTIATLAKEWGLPCNVLVKYAWSIGHLGVTINEPLNVSVEADLCDKFARLPREAAGVEERRDALKPGDQITSGDMLATGMRIHVSTLGDYVVRERERLGWSVGPDGQWIADSSWGQSDSLPVTFRGWAKEEKAGVSIEFGVGGGIITCNLCPTPHAICSWDTCAMCKDCPNATAKRAKSLAGKPDPTPTGLSGGESVAEALKKQWYSQSMAPGLDWQVYVGMDWGYPSQGSAEANDFIVPYVPQPSPPPRGLPFKRHPKCIVTVWHDPLVMCISCEGLIATDTTMRDGSIATRWPPERPQRPEPHRPSDTGMGSVVGPVLSRLR